MPISTWSAAALTGIVSLVVLSAVPGESQEPVAETSGFTDEDFDSHIQALRARLPHDGFTLVIQKPFVVIGDEPPERVKQRAEQTVHWAVDRLKREYFTQDPKRILNIWLFQDSASYEEHTEALTGRKPTTPYGFYSAADQGLFMNISTGGGTLVHEIVHPFIEANFPGCPAWFNEGLASLYEQSSSRQGRIVGLTNWRLKGLQTAIRKGNVPSFETLCGTTSRAFYQGSGTNYAQARYLCYYLQERGLLQKFYRQFRADVKHDPSGFRTLKAVLGNVDMNEFQQQWESEVLTWTFE